MTEPPQHDGLEHETVRRPLSCAACGHELRGLRMGGDCPECGFPVMRTVSSIIDPAARTLPTLRDPVGVGDGVLGVVACLAAATVLLLLRPAALEIDALAPGGAAGLVRRVPVGLSLVTAVLLLASLAFVQRLAPPAGEERTGPVPRGLRHLRLGLLVGAATSVAWWFAGEGAGRGPERVVLVLLLCGSAVLGLLALRTLLRVIGARSRQYRTSGGGRQGLRDMAAAVVGIALGEGLRLAGALALGPEMEVIGAVIAWVSALMLLIGFAYLLANAVWIRRSIVAPPPSLRELVEGEPPDEPDEH